MTAIIIAVIGVLVFALVWSVTHAPEGYQDKTGFHEGKEP